MSVMEGYSHGKKEETEHFCSLFYLIYLKRDNIINFFVLINEFWFYSCFVEEAQAEDIKQTSVLASFLRFSLIQVQVSSLTSPLLLGQSGLFSSLSQTSFSL